jgi:hypothetical protein
MRIRTDLNENSDEKNGKEINNTNPGPQAISIRPKFFLFIQMRNQTLS